MAVMTALAEWIAREPRRFTYRFVFAPGTIGSLSWLKRNESRLSRVRHADRKSTRLNSSHSQISYAVFCLKKKKKHHKPFTLPYTNRSTSEINVHEMWM